MSAAATLAMLPQALRETLEALGTDLEFNDLYSARGAQIYADSTAVDPAEIRLFRQVLPSSGSTVLELAAGTGRLTVPLVRLGHVVHALDLSEPMLDVLRRSAGQLAPQELARLQVDQGDMTSFHVDNRFDVILLMASSVTLLDVERRAALLDRVHEHLAPGGRFVFSVADETTGGIAGSASVVVRGRSGRSYSIHRWREPEQNVCHLAVYPMDVIDHPVPVCLSSHRVNVSREVLSEISSAGFAVSQVPATVSAFGGGLDETFYVAREAS